MLQGSLPDARVCTRNRFSVLIDGSTGDEVFIEKKPWLRRAGESIACCKSVYLFSLDDLLS